MDEIYAVIGTEMSRQVNIEAEGNRHFPENYVFMDADHTWPLYQLTEHVAGMWKTKLGL